MITQRKYLPFQMRLMFCMVFTLKLTTAPPNPILDNESDESAELKAYKFPDFDGNSNPYWSAFPPVIQQRMKHHDHMEIEVLHSIRPLDFKIREAWSKDDVPFDASEWTLNCWN